MDESREREEPAPSGQAPSADRPEAEDGSRSSRPEQSPEAAGDDLTSSPARRDDAEDAGADDDEDDDASDGDEGDEGAPPASSTEDRLSPNEEEVWGSGARSLVLAALLGFALASWAQLSFAARWANDLLASNELPEAGQRVTMIKAMVGGAVLAAGICAYFLVTRVRRKRDIGVVERWLWFASPLLLLPGAASVFRHKPWLNQYERLLPIVLFLAIVLEVLVFRALRAAPLRVREWVNDLRDQAPDLLRKRGPQIAVVVGVVFYVGFFSFYLLRWHYKLRTGNFDLSINNNLMYGGLHGHFLESPVVFPQDPQKYLANHAKFGGYLFLPLYALYPRAETLLVLQATLIGVSALPLWGFARRHLSDWAAAVVVLVYLSYYPMHGASFSEFQYVPIAGFFVLTTVWAAETRRWVVFGVAAAAGVLMREDIPIGMAVVGGFLLLSGYRPVPGLLLAALSLSYFLVLRFHVMEEAGSWWFPNMYKELWADGEKGFRSVLKTLISNPLYVFSKILVEKKILYLLHLLVPLVLLPARRWYLWAAFVPGAVLTLLVTNYDPPVSFSFHYVMHWVPYLFLATVLALKAIGERPDFGPERRRAALAALVGASLVLTYNYGAFAQRTGSFKGGFHKVEFELSDAERKRHAELQSLIALIPPDAPVAATEKLGPHLSSRVKMYTMRHGPQNADYALASSRELKLSRTKPNLLEALRSGRYGVMKRVGDMALLKRGYDTSGNEQLIRDWRLVDRRPAPEAEPRKEPEPEPKAPEDDPEAKPGDAPD